MSEVQAEAQEAAQQLIREWHDGMDRAVWPPDLLRLQVKLAAALQAERVARQQAEQRAAEAEQALSEVTAAAGHAWSLLDDIHTQSMAWARRRALTTLSEILDKPAPTI